MTLQFLLFLAIHPRLRVDAPLVAAAALFAYGFWPERRTS